MFRSLLTLHNLWLVLKGLSQLGGLVHRGIYYSTPSYERGPPSYEKGPPSYERGPPSYQRGPLSNGRGPLSYERGPLSYVCTL